MHKIRTIIKSSKNRAHIVKAQKGYTLVEVLVGLAIFSIVVIPLLSFSTKMAFSTKAKDLQIAYTLLKGECDIIYKNHTLPIKRREVKIGEIVYSIVCDYEQDSVLTSWILSIEKKKNVVTQIKGLAYIPRVDNENEFTWEKNK